MNDKIITQQQAFFIMQHLFRLYYKNTLSDDFGSMLGSIMLLEDDRPADEAFEEDFIDSAKAIIPNYHENQLITVKQACAIIKEFLELYCRIGFSAEVQQLIDCMKFDQDGNISDTKIKDLWDKAVQLAILKGPLYLQLGD